MILTQVRILRVKSPDTFFGLSPNAITSVDPVFGWPIDISITESNTIAGYLIDHYDGRRCTWRPGADTRRWSGCYSRMGLILTFGR